MVSYLIRRLLLAALTLLLVTFVVYALIRNMPGTPLTLDLATADPSKRISKQEEERLKRTYGLDKPWYIGYFVWLRKVAPPNFDLGYSMFEKEPVSRSIAKRLGPTLLLSGTSLFLAYVLSVPLGLYFSGRSGRWEERTLSLGMYMLYSLPSFVAALMLLTLFYQKLGGTDWELPLQGMYSSNFSELSSWGQLVDIGRHLILPLACLTYGGLAYDSRFIKANMEEALRQDYVRTARAKGAGYWRIVVVHAFRNTLIPFVTLLGLSLPALLSGAVILEGIFGWPGMGQLFFSSIGRRDYDAIMGLTLMFTTLTLLGQLLADILYAFVDPRVTYR
ncbi:MAG: ABC transporter permease [Pirellulaceae bacterium]|nr:ABC transporter permease [Pirellulaceae bacterium]